MEKLLTILEAAEILAVSPQHFRRHIINKGLIPVISLGKGCKGDRIDPTDLRALIDRQRLVMDFSKVGKPEGVIPLNYKSRSALDDILGPLGPRRRIRRRK